MAEPKESPATKERLATLEAEVARLRRENGETAAALAGAQARVRELEAARDEALDRIDWAVDSIHNLLPAAE
jgi:predicted  nucleic acid-binding Zn-ribbon protein